MSDRTAFDRDAFLRGLVAAAGLLVAVLGLWWMGPPFGHSRDYNLSWLHGYMSAIDAGAWWPRHLPTLWFGLGGLDFFFYGPFPFIVAAGPARLLCAGCGTLDLLALTGGLLFAASGMTFYSFARRFVGPWAALLGAGVYMTLPYHLMLDWVWRQALGEVAAYVFVPVVASGLYDLMAGKRPVVVLPIGFAGLLLCHLPSALLAVHVFGLMLLLWSLAHREEALRVWGSGPWLVTLGAGLAAVYWVPAIILLDDVSPRFLNAVGFQPRGALIFPMTDRAHDAPTWYVLRAVLLSSCAVALLALFAVGWSQRARVALWMLPVPVALVMSTATALPVWENWIIGKAQFPFRLMLFSDLSVALAASLGFAAIARRQSRSTVVPAYLIILLLAGGLLYQAVWTTLAMSHEPQGWDPDLAIGPLEYFPPAFIEPIKAQADREGEPFRRVGVVVLRRWREIEKDPAILKPEKRQPRRYEFAPSGDGPVTLAMPFWRHFVAETADGRPVPIEAAPDGLVRATPPSGAERITVRLPVLPVERIGLGLTLTALLLIGWGAYRARPG